MRVQEVAGRDGSPRARGGDESREPIPRPRHGATG
jgi:hypothetical protein